MTRLDRIEALCAAIRDGGVLPEADRLADEVAPLLPLLKEWEAARNDLIDGGAEVLQRRYARACESLFDFLRAEAGADTTGQEVGRSIPAAD